MTKVQGAIAKAGTTHSAFVCRRAARRFPKIFAAREHAGEQVSPTMITASEPEQGFRMKDSVARRCEG